MAEEARLESVWPPKGAREFESRSLRVTALQDIPQSRFCIVFAPSHFDRLSDQFTLSVELRLQKSIL